MDHGPSLVACLIVMRVCGSAGLGCRLPCVLPVLWVGGALVTSRLLVSSGCVLSLWGCWAAVAASLHVSAGCHAVAFSCAPVCVSRGCALGGRAVWRGWVCSLPCSVPGAWLVGGCGLLSALGVTLPGCACGSHARAVRPGSRRGPPSVWVGLAVGGLRAWLLCLFAIQRVHGRAGPG